MVVLKEAKRIIRKTEVNNQMIYVVEKIGNDYHIYREDKSGIRDNDPFWNHVITPEIYEQALDDYQDEIVPKSFVGDYFYQDGVNPIEDLNDATCINFTNWISHCYMSWNSIDNCWIYGRNKNYVAETGKIVEFSEEYLSYLGFLYERHKKMKEIWNGKQD